MREPNIPRDEESRLKALRSLSILDTPLEERFDRLTRLAKRLFEVPIALVSLVDENRQWFKSCIGLDVKETSREISFCGHAILGNDIFVISDATLDDRFADNPLVVNPPNIRFYAGYPLKYFDGSKLGTLCIIDTEPRTLSLEDHEALTDLAKLAEHELVAVQLATIDDLTKIANRRGFMTLAQNSLEICARQGLIASLVFFDLNGFKNINDQFGHIEGDRALITFAEQMKRIFRDSDVIGRIGGDEFVALLTDTSLTEAKAVTQRLKTALDCHNQEAKHGYKIAFSEGLVSTETDENSSVEVLLNQADALMYQSKLIS